MKEKWLPCPAVAKPSKKYGKDANWPTRCKVCPLGKIAKHKPGETIVVRCNKCWMLKEGMKEKNMNVFGVNVNV